MLWPVALVLGAFLPGGGEVGTEFRVETHRKVENWPCEVWCSHPGVRFVADPEMEKSFTVAIGEDVAPGACLVRLLDGGVASDPETFVLGSIPEINEVQATMAEPQAIGGALPVTVNGRLAKGGEVDFYSLTLAEGETLRLRLEGSSLGSPIDPHIIIYNSTGTRLVLASDSPGSLDPALDFVAPTAGSYIIAVMAFQHPPGASVAFHGAANAVYRLTLESASEKPSPAQVLDVPLTPPFDIAALLDSTSYPIFVREGESWLVKATSPGHDPVLQIRDPMGRLVKEVDDGDGSSDPEWLWKVEKTGLFFGTLGDRFGRTSGKMECRLSLGKPVPEVVVTVDKPTFSVPQGGETNVGITLARKFGHAAPVGIVLGALPEGVSAEIGEVPAGNGSVTLTLRASSDAPHSSQPWSVGFVEAEGQAPRIRPAAFHFPNEAPPAKLLIPATGELWLSIVPPAGPS